jgi:prevent-host-death family protein
MDERQPVTQTMSIADVQRQFSRLVDQVAHQQMRLIVEKDGAPVAAIISAADLARLERREREERFRILDEIGAAFQDVPSEELEREVTRALNAAASPA